MKLTFAGSGDAFGSGGRFNTCIHVERDKADGGSILIDCGASSMIALRSLGLQPKAISTIVLSHLHGDHFGGIPFFLLDAQFVSKRTTGLTIAGPEGAEARIQAAMEVLFPGSSGIAWSFGLKFVEMPAGEVTQVEDIDVRTTLVSHPSGAPSLALRLDMDGRTIAFSGDTEWTDDLFDVASEADLFICECYMYGRPVRFHLDYDTIASKLSTLRAKRIILTHMGQSMLENLSASSIETAEDGLVVEV